MQSALALPSPARAQKDSSAADHRVHAAVERFKLQLTPRLTPGGQRKAEVTINHSASASRVCMSASCSYKPVTFHFACAVAAERAAGAAVGRAGKACPPQGKHACSSEVFNPCEADGQNLRARQRFCVIFCRAGWRDHGRADTPHVALTSTEALESRPPSSLQFWSCCKIAIKIKQHRNQVLVGAQTQKKGGWAAAKRSELPLCS